MLASKLSQQTSFSKFTQQAGTFRASRTSREATRMSQGLAGSTGFPKCSVVDLV